MRCVGRLFSKRKKTFYVPGVVRVASFRTPRLSPCTQLARGRLHGHLRPRGNVFVTRDPGIVSQTLSTNCGPISLLVRHGRVANPTTNVLDHYNSTPICATSQRVLTRLANFRLAQNILYTFHHPTPHPIRRLYGGTHQITILRNVISSAGIKTVFHSTTTLGVSTILVGPSYYSPLYHHTIHIDVNAIFRIP